MFGKTLGETFDMGGQSQYISTSSLIELNWVDATPGGGRVGRESAGFVDRSQMNTAAPSAEELRRIKAQRMMALMREVDGMARSFSSGGGHQFGGFPMLSKQREPSNILAASQRPNAFGGLPPMLGAADAVQRQNHKRRRTSHDEMDASAALLSLSPLSSPALSCAVSVLATPDLLSLGSPKSKSPPPLTMPESHMSAANRSSVAGHAAPPAYGGAPYPVCREPSQSTAPPPSPLPEPAAPTVSPPPNLWNLVEASPTPECKPRGTAPSTSAASITASISLLGQPGRHCQEAASAAGGDCSTVTNGSGRQMSRDSTISTSCGDDAAVGDVGETPATLSILPTVRPNGSFTCLDMLSNC